MCVHPSAVHGTVHIDTIAIVADPDNKYMLQTLYTAMQIAKKNVIFILPETTTWSKMWRSASLYAKPSIADSVFTTESFLPFNI